MAITLKEAYGLNGCGADQIRYVSLLDIGPSPHDWDNRPIFGGLQIGQNYQVVIGSVTYLEGASQGFTIREYDYLSGTAGRAWEVGTDGSTSNLILTITGATKGTLLIYAGRAGQTTGNKVRFTNCSLYSLGNITGNLLPNSGGIYYNSAYRTVEGVSITYQNSGNTEVPEIRIDSNGTYAEAGIYFRTGNTTVYNQLICQAGYTYNVSFWAYSNKSGTSTFLDPLQEGGRTSHGSSLSIPNGVWTKVWSTATISKSCNTVIVLEGMSLGVNTTFYVKDIRVTRCTPEDTYWMAWIPSSNSVEQNERLPDVAEVNTLLDLHQNARSTYPFQSSLLDNPQTSLAWPRGVNPVTGIQILANTASTENYSYSSYFNIPSNTKFYISFWAQCSANIKGADVYILPDDYPNKGLVVKDRLPLNQTWTLYRYEFTSPSTWGDSVPVRIRFDNNGSNDGNEARLYLKDVNISLDIDHSNELASWEGFKYQISSRTRTIDTTEWSYSGNVRTKDTLNQQKILYSDGSASDWTAISSNSQSETAQYTDYGAWTYSDPKRTRTVTYRWSDGATNSGGTQTQTATTSTKYSAWTYSSDNSYRTRTATPVYTYTDTTRYGTATSQRENGTVSYGTWSYSGITRTRTVSYVYSDVTKTSNSQSETATLNSIVGEYTSSNPYNGNNQWTKAGGGTISVAVLGKYNFSDNVAAQQYVTNSCTYSYTNNNVGTWNASSHVMTISSAGTTIIGDSSTNTLTITYSGKTISVIFKRQANAITDYGTPTGGTMSYATIPASGGTISSGTLGGTVSQTRTYTSGSSDTYSQATPTNGTYGTAITASNLGATIKNAATVGTLIYTYTLNGKTGTVGNIVTQAGNYVTSLTLSSGTFSYPTISAGATSATPTVKGFVGTFKFTSGGSTTTTPESTYGELTTSITYSLSASQNGFTAINSANGVLTATSRGTTIGAARTSGTVTRKITCTWTPTSTYPGNTVTGTTSPTATCTQALNKCTSISIIAQASVSYSTVIPAGGGTTSPSFDCGRRFFYSSGAYGDPAGWTSSLSYSMTAGNGFTINTSTGVVTATSRGTVGGSIKSSNVIKFTITYRYTNPSSVGGDTVSASSTAPDAIAKQAENGFSDNSMKLHFGSWTGANTISVGAGASTTAMYLEVTRLYSSGEYQSGHNVTKKGTFTVSGTGFSISGSNVIAASRGTTAGAARSGTVTGKYSHLTATGTITQQENKVTNSNYNPRITAYGTPSVSIGSGITAAGGRATVTHSVTNTQTYNALYASGATGPDQTRSVAGTTTITLTGNGNSRFSLSGNIISHSSMGTNLTTDTVTVTATNSGQTSKTASASKSVTNGRAVTGTTGGVTTYGHVTAGSIINKTIPASGGSATATAGSGSQAWSKTAMVTSYEYDSGATSDATIENASSGTNTISPSVGSITASAASKGTTVSGTTTVKSQAVTWSGGGSKSASGTMYIYQAANEVVVRNNFIITSFSYPNIVYSGGTATPAATTVEYDASYTSGATQTGYGLPPGGALGYMSVSLPSGFSVNSTTGVVTAGANSSTSTRSATIRARVQYDGSIVASKDATVTQAGVPGPTRVNISINNPQLTGGEVVIAFSPACYDTLTILVMGYLQDGSLYSVYRNVGGGITEDRFYPNGAWADSASIENIDGEGVPPVTKTKGIYYW